LGEDEKDKQEKQEKEEKHHLERRQSGNRRTGKLDKKDHYAVEAGYSLDMRRRARRRFSPKETLISLN
jgi:hypothetical protein